MFDRYIFNENSLKNVVRDGKINGFQLQTRIPYYRGIPLSMVHDIRLEIDGEQVARDNMMFSTNREDWFTLEEMATVTTYKWEYSQDAIIFVQKEGGLSTGSHEVKLVVSIRNAYIPVPFEGVRTRTVEIT